MMIRSLAEASGNPQLKLAIAIGQESGLRIREVCNLRHCDIDLDKQELFVRLPNKTRTERYSPFHKRTTEALGLWLSARPALNHDFVFIGTRSAPLDRVAGIFAVPTETV